MGEIRSSWEITQDRVRNIGKLSNEERTQQREARWMALGKGVAEKYIRTADTAILEEELRKYTSPEREHLKKAVLQHLIHSISIYDSTPHRFSPGIVKLAGVPGAAIFIEQIAACIDSYREAEKAAKLEIEQEGRDILEQRAVSGTAIDTFNISARPQWKESMDSIAGPYSEKLEIIKQKLLEL